MFRINDKEQSSGLTFNLDGRLVSPWIQEFKTGWQSTCSLEELDNILVDLKELDSIDEKGKALLQQVYRQGNPFVDGWE